MTEKKAAPARPVVLRYEENWDELRGQIDTDRAAGLVPSAVRDALTDWFVAGSFVEIGILARRATSSYRGGDNQADETTDVAADGVVAGWGRHRDTQVFVAADDPMLGSDLRGEAAASKTLRVCEHALAQSAPIVQILASRRVDDDVFLGAEFARFGYGVALDFERESAERILKIAIVTGPLVEQAAIEASWCHLVVLAGPDAAISGHHRNEALARGFADAAVDDLPAALALAGAALDHLPASRFADPPFPTTPAWSIELAPSWHTEIRTTLGLAAGRPVGRIDFDPATLLVAAVSRKALRLARFCEAFQLPLIVNHSGLERPIAPSPADVDAFGLFREVLVGGITPMIEVASTHHSLADVLGVRPTWSVGPVESAGFDAVATGVASTSAIEQAVSALPIERQRPDQDPRVQHLRPRTLQGG